MMKHMPVKKGRELSQSIALLAKHTQGTVPQAKEREFNTLLNGEPPKEEDILRLHEEIKRTTVYYDGMVSKCRIALVVLLCLMVLVIVVAAMTPRYRPQCYVLLGILGACLLAVLVRVALLLNNGC